MNFNYTLVKATMENGVSTVTIHTPLGDFTGVSRLHPDEEEYFISKFAGCEYAERRALTKYLKKIKLYTMAKKEAMQDYYSEMSNSRNFNYDSYSSIKARIAIEEYDNQIKDLNESINNCEAYIKDKDAQRVKVLTKLYNKTKEDNE